MSAVILLAGAAALTATLMIRVALRRQAAGRTPVRARVPVTLASWSDDQKYQLAAHLRRQRR
jgi:hypothetical protein